MLATLALSALAADAYPEWLREQARRSHSNQALMPRCYFLPDKPGEIRTSADRSGLRSNYSLRVQEFRMSAPARAAVRLAPASAAASARPLTIVLLGFGRIGSAIAHLSRCGPGTSPHPLSRRRACAVREPERPRDDGDGVILTGDADELFVLPPGRGDRGARRNRTGENPGARRPRAAPARRDGEQGAPRLARAGAARRRPALPHVVPIRSLRCWPACHFSARSQPDHWLCLCRRWPAYSTAPATSS